MANLRFAMAPILHSRACPFFPSDIHGTYHRKDWLTVIRRKGVLP